MKHEIRIGVDTGGTFTDLVIYSRGNIAIEKIPSTPQNPSLAVIKGIQKFLNTPSSPPEIIHGTTVATNALLEGKGGRIALITTKGFEDILFIGRQTRKNLYSLKGEERPMLLPRSRCFGLTERTSPRGKVEQAISQSELKELIQKIKKSKIETVAVCLLHSYANPQNEKHIRERLEKELDLYICLSSAILPEYREYERTSVTVVNAFLMPVLTRYLSHLEKATSPAKLRIMQSNEGHISPSVARKEPIRTALSGPAGGVVSAFQLGKRSGFPNVISFDMGGTSCDVSLVEGSIPRTIEGMIGDFPVRLPLIDIHTVGAGGGSIAYKDKGGSLRVGPQSAGADPGPACYGRGKFPTVTDANIVLGRLVPEFFLGGKMTVYPEKSQKVLEKLAEKIGKSVEETALGIISIANANMEKAIRVISIERGYDPRNFALFSFGGAGGMHAAEIASQLNIPKVIVPRYAGVLSALGLLMADSAKDYSKSLLKLASELNLKYLQKEFEWLRLKSIRDMKEEGFQENAIRIFPSLDLRYLGQSYEITIPFKDELDFLQAFHKAHAKQYSYAHPQTPVEVVNIRIKAVGLGKKIRFKRVPFQGTSAENALMKRQALSEGGKKYQASVYNRAQLKPGNKLNGPALVVDEESTAFLPPFSSCTVDTFLNLIIDVKE